MTTGQARSLLFNSRGSRHSGGKEAVQGHAAPEWGVPQLAVLFAGHPSPAPGRAPVAALTSSHFQRQGFLMKLIGCVLFSRPNCLKVEEGIVVASDPLSPFLQASLQQGGACPGPVFQEALMDV